ncbi:MAG: transaldolase [Pseudonocardiales bacterium]|jgi:transaldolase|uniref:transaldolase n=1 Tax=Pseudonocardia sp. TaxID=60912 RepID=UPI00261FD9F7|nr:transaldolase [Pseudonocardia sp.]MCW2722931.1 Transaldolase [Pseudonocardia sp.]MDT7618524.1 transaldolase [Pseudonocardiales bacterium]MDT7710755.1 transaldolase [Pseudonocardiales bacterium]
MSTDRLGDLAAAGVSIWLDDLSRERLQTGNLQSLITDKHVVGVTTNPTIFAGALAHGEAYDEQVRELAARGASVDDAVREITVADVVQACDVFSGTYEATGGVDGRVSLEVDPRLAHDTAATAAQALDLWKAVDRPNLLVKIPATEAGLPAITSALAEGVSVNVTLIFSVERYRAVMGAYLDGLEQAAANGQNLGGIASVASFFVSRVDTEIDKRLEKIGTDEALALRGKAGIANSRLAYAAFQEVFSGPRWEGLKAKGAKAQRPLWASTGVKNPDYPDTMYVTELVVANTVNTMPEKTLEAFADHGEVLGDRVTGRAAEAQQVFDALTAVGIDLTDVFLVLESEGVDKFEKSWAELLESVQGQLAGAKE